MATFAKCSFTATSGTALTSYTPSGDDAGTWAKATGLTGDFTISDANRTWCGSTTAWVLNSGIPSGANYTVRYTLRTASNSGNSGVIVRGSNAAQTGYVVFYWPGNSRLSIAKYVAGAFTELDSQSFVPTVGQSYTIRIVCHDSYKKVYVNDIEYLSTTNNDITAAGQVGLWSSATASNSTGQHFDTLQADDGAVIITASPDDVTPNTSNVVITLTGTNTTWSDDGATFSISADNGATIVSQSVSTNTSATVTVNPGTTYGTVRLYTSSALQAAYISSTDLRLVVTGNSLFSDAIYSSSNVKTNLCPIQRVADAIGPRIRAYNFAVSGQSGVSYTSPVTFGSYYDANKSRNYFLIAEIINALKLGSSAATVTANIESVGTSARTTGYFVICTTPTPRSDAGVPADYETSRQTVATNVRASSVFDAVADLAGSVLIGEDNDELDTTYYLADAVHWNDTGAGVAADIIQAVIEDNLPGGVQVSRMMLCGL